MTSTLDQRPTKYKNNLNSKTRFDLLGNFSGDMDPDSYLLSNFGKGKIPRTMISVILNK